MGVLRDSGGKLWRRALGVVAVASAGILLGGCAPESNSPAVLTAGPTMVAPMPSHEGESGPAAAAEPTLLLGTLAASNAIAVIDPLREGQDAVVQRIEVGQAPWGIDTHGTTAYVATAEGLAIVDLVTGARTALVGYQHPASTLSYGEYREGGLGLAASPDGSRVYVAVTRGTGPSALEVFDTASGTFMTSVDVGLRPFDVVVSDDGGEVYSIDHDSFSVTAINTATFEPRSISVAPFGQEGGLASWEKTHYGVVNSDGHLLLPVQGQALVDLNPATGETTVAQMTGNSHQHGAAIATDVRTGARSLLVVGTGSFGSASGGPNLTIRSMADSTERIVPLERLHETVTQWRNPATQGLSAVLGGGYTRDGAWDGATVVDLETLASYEIVVEGKPQEIVPLPAEATASFTR
ncbi:YncE family protein [Lysinibacter cavernae]|uniref:DNA-binding beta-propeller fold protein YncE n=1 Tax=Lysinibacter cavernae TaxID=1640652 RepID=A0A7X5R433_9MICO|nr:hypothetical protein [Lysinibacter cavernae]NIH55288.1 DNA-binding beta-propeller fold protein YncE [Lysinibacter cavernae]